MSPGRITWQRVARNTRYLWGLIVSIETNILASSMFDEFAKRRDSHEHEIDRFTAFEAYRPLTRYAGFSVPAGGTCRP